MNNNKKTEIIGVVVSNKADKTITVKVETYKMDPIYKKRVKYSNKFAKVEAYELNVCVPQNSYVEM